MMKTQSKGWDEKRKIVLEVPPTAYPDTMKNRPDKIEFTVPATFRQSQGKQTYSFLKVNDYIVLDILKANKWQRPFYFSVTVTEDNFVGLGDYLVMQGMAMRLVPYKTGDANNPNNVVINKEIMKKCLLETPAKRSETPQYGFFFRGLNDKTIFYEEVQRRMIETYRSLFIRFAYSYSTDSTKSKEVIEILNTMEQKVPRDVVEMDYRLKYEVAMLYHSAGNFAKFNEYADEVEKAANEDIKNKKNISSQSYFNPYRLLLDIYDAKGNYQGALNLLDIMAKSNPNDASIIQKREAIKQKMSGNIKKDTISNSEEQKKYNEMP
jgi:tetratricopeptide (TPR) repeat protein